MERVTSGEHRNNGSGPTFRYLGIFKGADHMTIAGDSPGGDRLKDSEFHKLIEQGTTVFVDGYLRQNKNAQSWLKSQFKTELGSAGTFEQK